MCSNLSIRHQVHWFFLYSALAPFEVPLEVQMRFEQFITAVTRPVVVATVREIKAVVSFAIVMGLHLWLQRKSLGKPDYTGLMCMSPEGDLHRCHAVFAGSQRDRLQLQPIGVVASCPTGTFNA
jgi:hypothetical protein